MFLYNLLDRRSRSNTLRYKAYIRLSSKFNKCYGLIQYITLFNVHNVYKYKDDSILSYTNC